MMQDISPGTTGIRRPDPLELVVGVPYDSGITRWPGSELNLTTAGAVQIIADRPENLGEFSTGTAEFGWIDGRFNGLLCYRFGAGPWGHYPYNPHRDTPTGFTAGLPAVRSDSSLPLRIGFADLESERIVAIREVSWPHHFVSAVCATITRLAAQPFDSHLAADEANSLHHFVGHEQLTRRAGVRCRSAAQRITR